MDCANLPPCLEIVLFIDVLVIRRMEANFVDLHQRINSARKSRQSMRLKNDFQTLSVEFVREVEPISCHSFQVAGGDISLNCRCQ